MQDQVVLVTGASSGFGKLLAGRLAAKGYRVFGTSRGASRERAQPGGRQPEANFTMLPLDVRDDASVTACVEQVNREAGDVDVLVNNAGYSHEGPLEEFSLAELKALFETNFFGVVRLVNAVLPAMRARRRGRIVNVSSLAGLMPIPFMGAYCATKHALESYSESLRHELLPLGIHVSLIEPGYFKTGIAERKLHTSGRIGDYDTHRTRMYASISRAEQASPGPDRVVDLMIRVIESRRPGLRHPIGPNSANWYMRRVLPQRVWEWGLRRAMRLE